MAFDASERSRRYAADQIRALDLPVEEIAEHLGRDADWLRELLERLA